MPSSNPEAVPLRYAPEVFDVATIQAAKNIILTNEGKGYDTDARWQTETPYLGEKIASLLPLEAGSWEPDD